MKQRFLSLPFAVIPLILCSCNSFEHPDEPMFGKTSTPKSTDNQTAHSAVTNRSETASTPFPLAVSPPVIPIIKKQPPIAQEDAELKRNKEIINAFKKRSFERKDREEAQRIQEQANKLAPPDKSETSEKEAKTENEEEGSNQ